MTVEEWTSLASQALRAVGIESSRIEAQTLLAHAVGQPRSWILAHPEANAHPDAAYFLERRLRREPLAYILGFREFYSRSFLVSPGVLVPRQETEVLVEAALSWPATSVLDVGTGSGCIAITLKLEKPELEVTASDISPRALSVAQQNAAELKAPVEFIESDLFANLKGKVFHLVVSNPPYIKDGTRLQPEVGEFEPIEALFAGPTGLDVYRRLAQETAAHLELGGVLMVELGDAMRDEVANVFTERGWRVEQVVQDLDRNDRVLVLRHERSPESEAPLDS